MSRVTTSLTGQNGTSEQSASFDHLVGAREQCGEYFEAEGATQNPRQRIRTFWNSVRKVSYSGPRQAENAVTIERLAARHLRSTVRL
jgi:hypothetical protein